mmetsp:Transcript_19845/g.27702  ORF Transcript_19845/g.27702 Transcript_19845/m.27702 type:complete len:80 (-) Transcript_19845:179-418(-)
MLQQCYSVTAYFVISKLFIARSVYINYISRFDHPCYDTRKEWLESTDSGEMHVSILDDAAAPSITPSANFQQLHLEVQV